MSARFVIKFEGVEDAVAGKLAENLREAILDAHPDASAKRLRDDPEAQDLGTTLQVVLAAPAVVVVAKGIQEWLKLNRSAKITIQGTNGSLVAENVTGQTAINLVEKFRDET